MAKVKDKERILKAARGRQLVAFKGAPIRLLPGHSTETFRAERNWPENIPSYEKWGPTMKTTLLSKPII